MNTKVLDLYSKRYKSFAKWNGVAWEDQSTGAYFYTIEKANNNGYEYATTRYLAMCWWNELTEDEKDTAAISSTKLVGSPRIWQTLTGREIENLWREYNP